MAEQTAHNRSVAGSSPAGTTNSLVPTKSLGSQHSKMSDFLLNYSFLMTYLKTKSSLGDR